MTVPFSEYYDDVYFSAANGLAEKRYVFLNGNNLPTRWQDRSDFVIVEAGFGTGLSFLATTQTFLSTTKADQYLHFVSFEAHPMGVSQIRTALDVWQSDMGGLIDDLVMVLPRPVPGMHRVILQDRIFLTLVYGDINQTLPDMELVVDAWFLDGFNPAKNPAMWSDVVFGAMAQKSATGATAATYSAARVVKDGLKQAGFEVTKAKGFGYKSDMITARFLGAGRSSLQRKTKQRVAVLGGGLAGTATAWALKRHGHIPVIVAPNGIADGASGNPCGLYNPRFSKEWSVTARFYATAFARFHGFLQTHGPDRTGWKKNGALHVLYDPEQSERLQSIIPVWGWGSEDACIINAKVASEVAGLPVHHKALWLPYGGSVSPRDICTLYADGIEVHANLPEDYDAIVYANGIAALQNPELHDLPLHTVRGQISFMRANDQSKKLKTNLCFGGYLSVMADHGIHTLGATFQHWLHDINIRDEDHQYVAEKLHGVMGLIFESGDVQGGRVGFRVASRDHMPVVGRVISASEKQIYVSLAHGSHGLLSTHLAAWHIAEMVSGVPTSIDLPSGLALNPQRFLNDQVDKRLKVKL